jgi:hypothetical protein
MPLADDQNMIEALAPKRSTTNVIESSFATVQPGGGDCYLVEPYERTNRRPGLWLSR